MERLTYRTAKGEAMGNSSVADIGDILGKLADFEDFEEIFREKMSDIACEFLSDKEEFGKWLDRNKWISKKCDEYARAEGQGLLLRLPCKVGDIIYVIPSITNYKLNIMHGYSEHNKVYEQKVNSVLMFSNERYSLLTCDGLRSVVSDSYKKTWFLTRDEAEQKLKEMEGE